MYADDTEPCCGEDLQNVQNDLQFDLCRVQNQSTVGQQTAIKCFKICDFVNWFLVEILESKCVSFY